METKICKKCGFEKETCEFGILRKNIDGFRDICKKCKIIQDVSYREKNKEKISKKNKKYREENKEKFKEYNKEYYENNKNELIKKSNERLKKIAEENPDKIKQYRRNAYLKQKEKKS